jgi:hypothetical protein
VRKLTDLPTYTQELVRHLAADAKATNETR